MNVEPRPHRESGEVAEQLLAAGPARVGRDGLRLESLAQGEPPGAGAVVVHVGVHGSLEQVARVRRQVAHRSEEHSLNSSHSQISYAVFCLKKKNNTQPRYYGV